MSRSVFAALILITCPGLALAQLRDCPGTSTQTGAKVLIDDIVPAAAHAGSPEVARFIRQVQFGISAALRELEVEEDLTPLRCANRLPQSPGDFSLQLRDQLASDGVILEVWGVVDTIPDSLGRPACVAQIQYALFPVCTYRPADPHVPGFVDAVIETAPGASASALLEKISQSGELKAYTLVGLGIRALKQKHYDQAHEYFCRCGALLKQASGSRANSHLLDFTGRLASDTVRLARADAGYDGILKHLPEEALRSCN